MSSVCTLVCTLISFLFFPLIIESELYHLCALPLKSNYEKELIIRLYGPLLTYKNFLNITYREKNNILRKTWHGMLHAYPR